MTRVTLGKSRVRESCTPGSVRAKAKWLSYSTMTLFPDVMAERDRPYRGRREPPVPILRPQLFAMPPDSHPRLDPSTKY